MTRARGIVAARGGGVTVTLTVDEREFLRTLPEQLRPLLAGDHWVPRMAATLYSRGYDDEELEQEYRDLVGDDIVGQRVAAVQTFAATLEHGAVRGGRWRADLDAEEAAAWLSALNDGRLALGAILGITDESWDEDLSADEPSGAVMHYLGSLQSELLDALMDTLPAE